MGEGWDGWVSGGGEGWVSVGVGASVCKVRLALGWVWLLWVGGARECDTSGWAGLGNVTPLGGRCKEV